MSDEAARSDDLLRAIRRELAGGPLPLVFEQLADQPGLLETVWQPVCAAFFRGPLPGTTRFLIALAVAAGLEEAYLSGLFREQLDQLQLDRGILDELELEQTTRLLPLNTRRLIEEALRLAGAAPVDASPAAEPLPLSERLEVARLVGQVQALRPVVAVLGLTGADVRTDTDPA